MRSKIVRRQGQMMTFDFYFGLCLGQTLYNLTDNLSKLAQSESLSAVSAHRLTLEYFQSYYHTIVKKAAEHLQMVNRLYKENINVQTAQFCST